MTRATSGLTRQEIVRNLRDLGVNPGMTVLVHSSLSSIGWVEGGAECVIDALVEAVSPAGTILVPTLTGTESDGPQNPPRFDPSTSPSWTGTIPETFRRYPAAQRSHHPTHSVAGLGPGTSALIEGHAYVSTPCAPESPYGRLTQTGGKILLLGVTHESNTCLHMVEELARVPYHMQPEPSPCFIKREDGTWEEIVTGLHLWRWDRNFPKIDPLLTEAGAQTIGHVGQAICRLVDVAAMRDILLPILARDPLFLLSDETRAEYRQAAELSR